jgi:hypothetical protein
MLHVNEKTDTEGTHERIERCLKRTGHRVASASVAGEVQLLRLLSETLQQQSCHTRVHTLSNNKGGCMLG